MMAEKKEARVEKKEKVVEYASGDGLKVEIKHQVDIEVKK